MVAAGATPDFIQTGNEISYGMLWGAANTQANRCFTNSDAANWTRFFTLLRKAGAACREVCPNAKIILHSERVPKPNVLKDWLDRLKNSSVDYDIIGLSYYPFHHGSLAQLELALKQCVNYNKDIMIVEAGYYYAWQPAKKSDSNPKGIEFDYSGTYPITPIGQQQFAKDLIATLKKYDRVTGLYWWWMEACENGVNWQSPVTKEWYNASLFNDSNMDDTGWYYGKVMPAMQELKSFVGESSSVNTLKAVSTDDHWYTLGGQQLPARPQRSGVYLHNDRKHLVK
jgi:arabinogalactan endo-1,4-beta-galactosidase